jgi:L-methionine (R)-S-oxide reductase
MAESVYIPVGASRAEIYEALTPQLKALLMGERDFIANAANLCALVSMAFRFHWVGFYRVNNQELVLGPFQGPVACTRIAWGKGVCGTAWQKNETVIVPDVDAFPGHIACSALSKSEIVVPVHSASNDVVAVLDIDSSELNDFSEVDKYYLEKWVTFLSEASHA